MVISRRTHVSSPDQQRNGSRGIVSEAPAQPQAMEGGLVLVPLLMLEEGGAWAGAAARLLSSMRVILARSAEFLDPFL